MVYNVRVFYNTGFDPENIPFSADIITANFTHTSKVFDSVFELQNKNLAQIKIKATWDEIDGADYLVLSKPGTDTWYFITNIEMINQNTVLLYLQLDALTSIGLNNLTDQNLLSGLTTIHHPDNYKELFHNNIPQTRLTVGSPLTIKGFQAIGLNPDLENQHVIGSTCNLLGTYEISKKWLSDSGIDDEYLLTPKLPDFAGDIQPTFLGINTESLNYRKKIEGYTLYSLGGNINMNNLQPLFEIGLSDCICCSYSIPENYVKSISYSAGYITELTGGVTKEQISTLPYEYTPDIINKIVFSNYVTYTLTSITTGDSIELNPYDIYEEGTLHPAFITFADLSPQGKPYARPHSYKGNIDLIYMNSVQGANWLNIPLRFVGADSEFFTVQRKVLSEQINKDQQVINMANGITAGLLSGGNDITPMNLSSYNNIDGMRGFSSWARQNNLKGQAMNQLSSSMGGAFQNLGMGAIFKSAGNITNLQNQLIKEGIDFTQNIVKAPTIAFAQQPNLQQYFGNGFVITQTTPTPESAKQADKFINMFGEEVVPHKTIMKDFNSRQNFNYVQTTGVKLKTTHSRYINSIAESQLNGGVRIWHRIPDPSLYDVDNPVKGVS